MKKHFPLLVNICLVSVYAIFLAGSVVRMTGSGMGCPDWPKCFGYTIPPTEESQLLWSQNKEIKEGYIIIQNEKLWVAQKDFTTSRNIDWSNWEEYTRHSYAKFNVYHTWTEYINRLSSVVSGFLFIFLVISSFYYWKEKKIYPILVLISFFLMGFEAWLGKIVVDSNLEPYIITVHMLGGLLIIGILLYLRWLCTDKKTTQNSTILKKLAFLSMLSIFFQILLGTQVREFVDQQISEMGFEYKQLSLLEPNMFFYIHRSFTIIIVLLSLYMLYIHQMKKYTSNLIYWIVGIIAIETLTGIIMYYVDFPMGTQSIHLLLGAILFGLQYYMYLQASKTQ
ncbi:MAG: COX15/CtaA family protein [Flavobacteriaceae bacterium]|nr:COX15/CtaA family protein [Flavobacteriaceae bacterium]